MRLSTRVCSGLLLSGVLAVSSLLGSPSASGSSDKPLATAEHEAGGVTVELLSVQRTGPDSVTVKWRYRNTTHEAKKLTKDRTGWIDPYRLSSESYLLDEVKKVKYEVAKDTDRRPVASRNGSPNQWIVVQPGKTIDVWAKYLVPDSVTKVTVAIDGVAPFEGISIAH